MQIDILVLIHMNMNYIFENETNLSLNNLKNKIKFKKSFKFFFKLCKI